MTATQQLALSIQARGEIISSNFPEFAEMVRAHLATFNRDLKSDDDFDQADKDTKAISAAESTLKAAKEKALEDAVELHSLFDQIDGLTGELAIARLDLQRQIARRKEEVKAELVEEHLALFDIDPIDARKLYAKPLLEATKAKRTIDSMRAAMRVLVASQHTMIESNRKAIASFEKAHGPDMTMDRRELEVKSNDFVTGELRRRFEAKKAAEERKRLEAEAAQQKRIADELKAQAEAKAKAESEPAQQMRGMLPADNLPTPPKIGSIPVGNPRKENPRAITEEEELDGFMAKAMEVFTSLRTARESLKYARNRELGQVLANRVNQGWKELKAAKLERGSES